MPPAVLELQGGVAILRFDRAERMNVLGLEGDGEAISALISEVQWNQAIRALVITGAGKAFSAGGDLKAMKAGALSGPAHEVAAIYRRTVGTLVEAIDGLGIPVIAAINGPAVGLGCGIACLADIRIASERAKFAMPFVRLGLIAGDGSLQRLAEIVGRERAARLIFTGETIAAGKALEWGLVGSVVPADELTTSALALAEEIADRPPLAVKAAKSLLRTAGRIDHAAFREMSWSYQAILHQTSDFREAVDALLEKRDPRFTGE